MECAPASVDDVIDAIVRLAIRGAPGIGVAGGVALAARAEHALWQRILRSARVKVLPGTAFACPEPGWFRLCHAIDASTVATGIIRALETS